MAKDELQGYIDKLNELQSNKDINQIAELFLSIVSMYGLTMDEVASVSYYLVNHTVKVEHNKVFIKEHFGIDVEQLGIEGIQTIQRALIAAYVDKVRDNDAS